MHEDEQSALNALYLRLGTWRAVSEYLAPYGSGGRFYPALVHKVAFGRANIERVTKALAGAGLINPPPKVAVVDVCPNCDEVHTFHSTCAERRRADTRSTRAWHGTGKDAAEIDRVLERRGYKNVRHYIEETLLRNKNGQ